MGENNRNILNYSIEGILIFQEITKKYFQMQLKKTNFITKN